MIIIPLSFFLKQEVSVFYSYAHEDEKFVKELEKQLGVLKRMGVITTWHDRKIKPGEVWKGEIDEHLESAQVILLLISPDFVASDYCWEIEMARALQLHEAEKAVVIPIVLKEVAFLDKTPFAKIQMLPKDAKPITQWKPANKAWSEVARAIGEVCQEVGERAIKARTEVLRGIVYQQELTLVRLDEIAAEAKLQRAERMEAMKRLAETAASLPPDFPLPRGARSADEAFKAFEGYIGNGASDADKDKREDWDPPGPSDPSKGSTSGGS